MTRPPTDVVLEHYGRRYIERLGKMPRKKDLDPDLAGTLICWFGDVEHAVRALDAWFDATDRWYETQGFSLWNCFTPLHRLIGTGEITPKNDLPPHELELARKLCAAVSRDRPHLRLVRPGDES
jgi:hypothetical protein